MAGADAGAAVYRDAIQDGHPHLAGEIQAYYDKTLLPEYAKEKAPAPKLETISDRIQEILLQQRVGALLEDWLKSLKAEGSVRMAKAGEVEP